MSWPTWSAAAAPIPTAMAAPVQSTIMPTAINSAPNVMPPNIQYSPEQWAQAQQQNWQQWAQWQQQYQQWHQQYGAEYQKSMTALQGLAAAPQQPPLPTIPNTGVPPPLPAEPKPPLPPEDPPANQPTSLLSSYSTMAPKPANAGYSTAPPSMVAQQPQYQEQGSTQRSSWQTTQVNPNKRPYVQSSNEPEQNKRPLLDRSKQWGNQKQGANQWGNQPPANMSYNQPPPPQQPSSKSNIEELSEAEKKFDKEFAAWEAQFNKWKDQNANHPDKTQYLEYEKKWESWRNSLLERREQMRKKRLAMSGAATSIGVTKPTGFTQMPNVQQPSMEQSRPTGYGTGPVKPAAPSPVRQQAPAADFPVNPNLPNLPLPHQNNEPLSFKPQTIEEIGEDFLKPSSGGGIPGLDLVKDDDGMEQEGNVIGIDTGEKQIEEPPPAKGPDFDAISKGINSILGDQKLLSMLSMVSQNPASAPAVNIPTNSMPQMASGHNFSAPPPSYQYSEAPPPIGGFSAPPPFHHNEPLHPIATPNINDQSNHSYEERAAYGENYQQHESVHNFDDQTRSSFTMGPNDQDMGYGMNNFSRNQMNRPPNRFMGAPPSDNDRANLRSNFGPNANRPNDPGFGGNMSDNRNKFGPGRGDTRFSNISKNTGSFGQGDNFNRNDRRGRNLNNDNFNQGNQNNRQDNYQNDNFSNDKYGDNFNSANNYKRNNFGGPSNFEDRRNNFGNNNNFNRSGNANDQRRYDADFTKDDYDDYENYNDDEDYDKYHEMFNDDNEDMGPQHQGQRFQQRQHQGQGGPQRQNQGPGGPPSQNQGFGGPTHKNQGQSGPPFQNQGQGGPPRQNQGQGMPPHQNQNQGMPSRFNQFQGAPPYHDQGLGQQEQQQAPPRLMDLSIAPPPEAIPEVVVVEEEEEEEEPIFEPTTVIDYDHKCLKPAEPEVVVEPIHMFDYHHKPLNRIPIPQRPKWLAETVKFIREFDLLASRGGFDRPPVERYPSNSAHREEWGPDVPNRGRRFAEEFERPARMDRRSFAREEARFERDQVAENYSRRERKSMSRDDPKQENRNQYRVDDDAYNTRYNEDDMIISNQRGNKDFEELSDEEINFENRELQKHQLNRDDREGSRSPMLSNPPNPANVMVEIAMIEDIINPPGRFHRPPRIVIILRGPPGSGKTYLAKLIKDKEVENGGSAPRILSLDDYFMVEHEKEVVEDGKRIKVKEMVYEYEAEMEESYRNSFIKSFKKTVTDGYFPFIIVDNVNDKVKYFGEMWSFAKQNGFQVYICQLDLDPALCTKRNIHNRSQAEIEECIAGWEPTPSHHPTIEASGFLQLSIMDVEMEEVEPPVEEKKPEETPEDEMRSKWDTFDCSINNLAKLDGVHKPLRSSRTMEDYLQMENEWEPVKPTKSGQKRVRWADLEEQREQKKMRAIGFIVGHTNWNRMMDPTDGSSALTQTKYI